MKHLKLFEEFNPYTGRKFAQKLVIYAKASSIVRNVTPIKETPHDLSFEIHTNVPGDTKMGDKIFKVIIPDNYVDKAYVETYEGGEKVFTASLEPDGENDINDILMNYIEATELYDDSAIEKIVDAYRNIDSPDDIKRLVRTP